MCSLNGCNSLSMTSLALVVLCAMLQSQLALGCFDCFDSPARHGYERLDKVYDENGRLPKAQWCPASCRKLSATACVDKSSEHTMSSKCQCFYHTFTDDNGNITSSVCRSYFELDPDADKPVEMDPDSDGDEDYSAFEFCHKYTSEAECTGKSQVTGGFKYVCGWWASSKPPCSVQKMIKV